MHPAVSCPAGGGAMHACTTVPDDERPGGCRHRHQMHASPFEALLHGLIRPIRAENKCIIYRAKRDCYYFKEPREIGFFFLKIRRSAAMSFKEEKHAKVYKIVITR
jgi:hypothetical protein